jgi:DNA-binding NarL/FixJ family response regulator
MNQLTPRQSEVFDLLVEGYTYREIAQELYISTTSVKKCAHRATARLGARTLLQAVIIYMGTKGNIAALK